ncbi:MAG: GNAT family N-acetyltransferase [Patescibacteria group bacterium]
MNRSYKIIFYKKLLSDLKKQLDQLINESFFWHKSGKEKQVEYDKFCSKKNEIGYVIALENNLLIGVVIVLKRNLVFNQDKLVLGGIGGVSVKLDKRRKGIATALLKEGMKILKQNKCDLAYLCTDINKLTNLYVKVGFVPLNRQHSFLGRSGKRYTEYDAMIAPVNSQSKFQAVLSDKKPFDIGRGNW